MVDVNIFLVHVLLVTEVCLLFVEFVLHLSVVDLLKFCLVVVDGIEEVEVAFLLLGGDLVKVVVVALVLLSH